jgi:hypothetical protein
LRKGPKEHRRQRDKDGKDKQELDVEYNGQHEQRGSLYGQKRGDGEAEAPPV